MGKYKKLFSALFTLAEKKAGAEIKGIRYVE